MTAIESATASEATPAPPTRDEILGVARAVYAGTNAIELATVGADGAPWVLGAYFVHDGDDLLLFLEASGSSLQNVLREPRVAFVASQHDAMKDFVQGRGTAVRLSDSDEAKVRARLLEKMPWYVTYTPVVPLRVRVTDLRVSSLQRGWFPACRASLA